MNYPDGVRRAFEDALKLFEAQQRKYGDRPVRTIGDVGCAVEAASVSARLLAFYLDGAPLGEEKVEDLWLDLIVYGGLGLRERREHPPKV